jgi:hypothetical protein
MCWFNSNNNSTINYKFDINNFNNLVITGSYYFTQNFFPTNKGDIYLYQVTNQIAVYNSTNETMIFLTSNKN